MSFVDALPSIAGLSRCFGAGIFRVRRSASTSPLAPFSHRHLALRIFSLFATTKSAMGLSDRFRILEFISASRRRLALLLALGSMSSSFPFVVSAEAGASCFCCRGPRRQERPLRISTVRLCPVGVAGFLSSSRVTLFSLGLISVISCSAFCVLVSL